MKMPLFTTEEKNFDLASRYYPQVHAQYAPDLEHNLGLIAQQFDALFECKYWAPHLKSLFRDLFRKEMRLVFCAHGQSDKGYATPLLLPYSTQDFVLLYGDLLKEMISELGAKANFAFTGNYRLAFYQQFKTFYDEIADREIFSLLPRNNRTLLYAPTWSDADQSTSFFESASLLFSELPPDWNLILKLHPLLEQREPSRFYRIAALADKKPNILLVSEFPPVYPILSRADAYLGDYSSVGYDYLFFQRPMYFLLHPTLPKGRLQACGTLLDSLKTLFSELEKPKNFREKQASLYRHAFGENRTEEEVRKNILSRFEAAR